MTPAEIIASANVTDPKRFVKSSLTGFITFAKIDFNCPHCGKKYSDEDDKYVNRCNSNKDFCTSIKCDCGEKFKMTYDITGKAVAWE